MRLLAAAVVLVVVAIGAVVALFTLVIALNGFSDRDGGVAIGMFVVIGLLTPFVAAAVTPFLMARRARRRSGSPFTLGVVTGSALGAAILLAGFIGCVILANVLRERNLGLDLPTPPLAADAPVSYFFRLATSTGMTRSVFS